MENVGYIKKDKHENWYRLLYFVTSSYPIYFLWRPKTNDHKKHWLVSALIISYILDYILFSLLYSRYRSYIQYVFRDVLLTFTMATCGFLSMWQTVISHPEDNSDDNQHGLLETEQDGNLLCAWASLFMTLIVWNQIQCHRRRPYVPNQKKFDGFGWSDILSALSVILMGLTVIPGILSILEYDRNK